MANADQVLVNFGDGVERELDYSAAQVKAAIKQHGSDQAIMSLHFATDLLPLVYEGLVDKAGLTYEQFEGIVKLRRKERIMAAFFMAFWGQDYDELKQLMKDRVANAKNDQSSQTSN
jgi:hypothetical protein